ncbi:phosphoribosyltransferase [Herbiconiux daphne]|uniref:Phosphoribosyltransferase family protein n=1 Tax=Herbiconiux daphne TaxID=2970914 RepID=A0ABT2GWB5_9MICO|nr:phosphoribosyltransferase family protein [Herbiconiux daphne]MCS5732263.1 phosphoribosyltransferase family protein [Herbiconiux daphne]
MVNGYSDRREAGRRLGRLLAERRLDGVVVIGLPRGGVIVAAEVARALGAPLDVVVVRKLGLPMAPEVAMGAIAEGGIRSLDTDLIARHRVAADELALVELRERRTLLARSALLRGGRAAEPLDGRVAVVVDDGVATGATARVACRAVRRRGTARVVLAVPVAAASALRQLALDGTGGAPHEIVCPLALEPFGAVGRYYAGFEPVDDDEVVRALAEAGGGVRR